MPHRPTTPYVPATGHNNAALLLVTVMTALCLSLPSLATADAIEELQHGWAKANYQLTGADQLNGFDALLIAADNALAATPKNAELLISRGIIRSTYAGAKGGLGALKIAKAAKADLEAALKIDPTALSGSAYTSLGTLYANLPGWPIGFGSDKKARKLLEKALQINPYGIDSNYFYAEFIRGQGKLALARDHYQRALAAPLRVARPLADSGRRSEIERALTTLN